MHAVPADAFGCGYGFGRLAGVGELHSSLVAAKPATVALSPTRLADAAGEPFTGSSKPAPAIASAR